ncbi:LapA family protein [Sphingomonas donggukensis]|uniref:LapA family protein n=1 Tax=Sphingomonas donggukensis TaxID=2949093 RepID=A0ABY4TXY2_9SPHN|nr:LapA family protein [Sphingomonas donggukensis]URW76516.1 LapA family protein [Sphingomonas donggukensis]
MQFLKTLLIVFTVALGVAFAFNNWDVVPVRLWGGMIVDINLPLLMLVCFLAGLVPTWLWHYAVRWRLKQRLSSSERAVQDLRTVAVAPAPIAPGLITPGDAEPVPPLAPAPAPPQIDDPRP